MDDSLVIRQVLAEDGVTEWLEVVQEDGGLLSQEDETLESIQAVILPDAQLLASSGASSSVLSLPPAEPETKVEDTTNNTAAPSAKRDVGCTPIVLIVVMSTMALLRLNAWDASAPTPDMSPPRTIATTLVSPASEHLELQPSTALSSSRQHHPLEFSVNRSGFLPLNSPMLLLALAALAFLLDFASCGWHQEKQSQSQSKVSALPARAAAPLRRPAGAPRARGRGPARAPDYAQVFETSKARRGEAL